MQKKISLKLKPSEAADDAVLKKFIANTSGEKLSSVSGYTILKRSIDARSKTVWMNITVNAFINEPFHKTPALEFIFKDVSSSAKKTVIIGGGPAGLFAALKLIALGIKPIVLERGKDVRSRRRDLALLNKEGIINPNSNYCFGEGGAGTYSDGKLYTRSNKRGDIDRILQLFVHFGADENILYEAHPHIGTNKLPLIITAMRKQIEVSGGEFYFNKQVTDFDIQGSKLCSVKTSDGDAFNADAFILATGHSARDIFELLTRHKIEILPKPFALGVRIEHPQILIDSIQYHTPIREEFLPPASYSLVQQVDDKGVFSFCMCPGGIIAPASTAEGEIVVNGWSPSKRNNPFANSGMVVQIEESDIINYRQSDKTSPLKMMHFQKEVEQNAFIAGGGKFVAPAQRMVDFTENRLSSTLPVCSYLPGIHSASLSEVLPEFIFKRLQVAFRSFGKRMKGYYSNEAVVVATESRTSSPVKIPRTEAFHHPQLINLYPCGEGAGFAGGIVSAAMDGEKVADVITSCIFIQ